MTNLEQILTMPYVDFMAFIKETNRAPGGEKMLVEMAKNTFLNHDKNVLHIACNTWSALRELHKLTGCTWTGIDINTNMVATAIELSKKEHLESKINYEAMNAHSLSFADQSFDISYTTWGMAFVPDKSKAISEMVRVTKDNWFVADIVMYYKQEVPDYLIDEMNTLMNINIQKWDKEFWVSLYESQWLKLFHQFEWEYAYVDNKKLLEYCRQMSFMNKDLTFEESLLVEYKLFRIMSLFAENHKYLGASLLIFRKIAPTDQISLFT